MDILTIAAREGNRAYEAAEGNEAKAEAYYRTVTETRKRGLKAEEILAAGLVSPNGGPGQYDVKSQNGGGTYHGDIEARTCTCPDRQNRPYLCKHLQAAMLADAQGSGEDGPAEVVLEAEGYARGRQLLNKRLVRVREDGSTYRKAKDSNFDNALAWLTGEGYELAEQTKPETTMGRATVRYTYRKAQDPEPRKAHADALPVDRPRRRDRLFKGE